MTQASNTSPSSGLLGGLRVVEIGHPIAAPLVGLLLGEQGAEVASVVTGAALGDEVLAAMLARGKRELPLDLALPADRARLAELIAVADVVVENLPPGRLASLGLDLAALRRENPGLVTCSIPSFPAGDPRSSLPEHEALASAAGLLYDKPIGPPRYHEFPIASVMAALQAAGGIVAALIARLRLGRGQHVDASLHHASLFAQILPILVKTGVPRGFLPLKMVGTPFMSPWLCRDGRYVYLHITLPVHNARILDLLEAHGFAGEVAGLRRILSPETMRDPSQVKSIPEAKKIRRAYEAIFRSRDADEWERLLGRELCCIKVRTADEWVRDSLDAGMADACVVDDPRLGPLTSVGPAVASPDHPPRLAGLVLEDEEGLDHLLARWSSAPMSAPVEGAPPLRHPLDGVRVLDLSRVIAGPCAARVLAELGADVISVQSPKSLDWALSFHLVFNAGKRSVTLDFTTDEGKRKLWALIDEFRPQVLLQNYRNLDLAREIGLHPEALRARFPDLVYLHLNAYGNEGGWRDRPGFEQVVQAVTGIQTTYGRGGKPRLLPTPIIDIGSGLAGALAGLLGLYHRARTGEGVFAATHLSSTAVLFQARKIAEGQRDACLARIGLRHDPREEIVAGVVRALDAWACLAGPRGAVERWLRGVGAIDRDAPVDGDPIALAARAFWRRPLRHWRSRLASSGERGVALIESGSMRRLIDEARELAVGATPIARKREFPGCPTPLAFVRSPLSLSLTPLADVAPPPVRGQDTRDVLALVGEQLPDGAGVVRYPEAKPLVLWASDLLRWAYFAWRSGNI